MKAIFLSLFFLGAAAGGPGGLDAQESLLTKTLGNSGIIYSIVFSPDGKYIASGGVYDTLKIWRMEDGSAVKTFKGHKNFVNSVAFSPDGKRLASASEDGTVKIWDLEAGACLNTLKGHRDSVWSVAFFPDGGRLASGSTDGTIKIWRAASRSPERTISGRSGYIYSVSISPDGKYLASGGAGRTIKIWDVKSGARKLTLEGHSAAVNSVAFSKTGDYLASGSDDGSVKLWRVKDGVCVKTFNAGRQPVLAVAYAPDDAHVFSGGGDRTVSAWNISSGMLVRTFQGHSGSVKSLALSCDGKYLASGSFDKTIKLWLTPWEAEARNNEIQKAAALEAERNKNYSLHYEEGLRLLASPTLLNLRKAVPEFTQALSFKQDANCKAKLREASETLLRKERLIRTWTIIGVKFLAVLIAFLALARFVYKTKKKMRFRKILPEEIRMAAVLGDYNNAFEKYTEYKALGGETRSLPREDLLRLYHGMGALDNLPKEDIPYDFLLSYAVKFCNAGDYKTALHMLRSGVLLDEFEKPEEYDAFVEIYEKAHKPENLLMRKFKPAVYSGLAEAFFKAGNYDYCEKICAFKKRFHPSRISRRDKELLAACQPKKAV